MKSKFPIFLVIGLVLLAGMACRTIFPEGVGATPDLLGTAVVETLTAAAPTASVGGTEPAEPGTTPDVGETAPAPGETGEPGPAETPPPDTPQDAPLRVAYIKEGDVWLWEAGGVPVQLTEVGDANSVNLSDDGQVIAFLRQVDEIHAELWAVNADGSNPRVLEDVAALTDMDAGALAVVPYFFEWIPGTHTLAYNTRQVLQGPGLILYNDLRLVDADSLDHSTLLAPGQGGMFTYSPDASRIAVVTPTQISIVQADASNRREVHSYGPVLTYSEFEYYAAPVWTPDGETLRFAIPPNAALENPGEPTVLYEAAAAGGNAVELGSIPANRFSGSEPFYSPDASRIAYTRRVGGDASELFELHLAAADGTGDSLYQTARLLFFEAWAGSSDRFIFSLMPGEARLFLYGGAEGEPRVLAMGEVVLNSLRWVGEDQYTFIATAGEPETWELRINNLDGGSAVIDTPTGPIPDYDVEE